MMNKNKLILAFTIVCISLPSLIHCMTPNEQLLEATKNWDLKQAQEALDAGADANCQDNAHNTALHRAAFHGDAQIALFLLQKCAAVNTLNSYNLTALHCVASSASQIPFTEGTRDSLTVAKLLLAAGAHINAQASDDETPLHRAVTSNQVALVKLLIEQGARLDLISNNGKTALGIAKELAKLYNKPETHEIIKLLSNNLLNAPSLKYISAWALIDLVKQNIVTLEHVKNNAPEELYEFITKQL